MDKRHVFWISLKLFPAFLERGSWGRFVTTYNIYIRLTIELFLYRSGNSLLGTLGGYLKRFFFHFWQRTSLLFWRLKTLGGGGGGEFAFECFSFFFFFNFLFFRLNFPKKFLSAEKNRLEIFDFSSNFERVSRLFSLRYFFSDYAEKKRN